MTVLGIGGASGGNTRGSIRLRLHAAQARQSIMVTAHVLPQLTVSTPSFSTKPSVLWPHVAGLSLADPEFLNPGGIDVILGADSLSQLLLPGLVKGSETEPVAQRTVFGWIVYGPCSRTCAAAVRTWHISAGEDLRGLQELLTRFWIQEEVAVSPGTTLNQQDRECEEHFRRTHSRDLSGRYTVRLPLSASISRLGESQWQAQRVLDRTLHRFSRDQVYRTAYDAFLSEYEKLGHMRRISDDLSRLSGGYFLPHHGVLPKNRPSKELRVVFDGSCKTTTGISLNDILHTGHKLQLDIFDVLLRVRTHRYLFATDIVKMFRQIRIHPDDRQLQRIVWTDPQGTRCAYELNTVTYGTRSAPFLAARVIQQLVRDEGNQFPMAVKTLTNNRYVDDIYGGADSTAELMDIARHLIGMCAAGGFPLAKWQSNVTNLLKFTSERVDNESVRSFECSESAAPLLGLLWRPQSDELAFSLQIVTQARITKRTILSEVAQLYDPLGILAPVLIRAKMLIQELWLTQRGWDDDLSPALEQRWISFRDELAGLIPLRIPRWVQYFPAAECQIHGFADASQLAMAAVVFLRVRDRDGLVRVTFLCAKSKVAPLKRLTIPRLELSAAVLLARLVAHVQDTLTLGGTPTFLWTDSSIALTWLSSHPSKWKEYVSNRVALAQEVQPHSSWRSVPGKDNPADCATRGLSVAQLELHRCWWDGPTWLVLNETDWPKHVLAGGSAAALEERPGYVFHAVTPSLPVLWDRFSRFSSLNRLLRVTAWCWSFRRICLAHGSSPSSRGAAPTVSAMARARDFWVRAFQASWFPAELRQLSGGNSLPASHSLAKLTPFLDQTGTLRVGGRLHQSSLDPETQHPAILPRDSPLTKLIIDSAHQRTFHGGTQLTLAETRRSFWILGGRTSVRSFILRCVICARQRGVRAQQLMGQLPRVRLTASRPFLNTGVDYAGPVTIKAWRGRGSRTFKGWMVIFVCLSSSAVHLEAVEDYSAEAFIAAYRRFVGRRGICRTLHSDCGTTFLGADKELRRLFTQGSRELGELAAILATDGTSWRFNPPAAPHFGGKWEAAVKSVKHHLRRTVRDLLVTFNELITLLIQIEAVLNSRPLSALSDDAEDLNALTPAHFLIGHALTTVPEPSLEEVPMSRLGRWQLLQQRIQHFWARWSAECLQRYLAISKWHHPSHEIKVGSLVLITDERLPPSKWPLARVTGLHPGPDNLTRVVDLRTATTQLTRPIAKLAVLPVEQ